MTSTRFDEPAKVVLVPAGLRGDVEAYLERRLRARSHARETPGESDTGDRPSAAEPPEIDECDRRGWGGASR